MRSLCTILFVFATIVAKIPHNVTASATCTVECSKQNVFQVMFDNVTAVEVMCQFSPSGNVSRDEIPTCVLDISLIYNLTDVYNIAGDYTYSVQFACIPQQFILNITNKDNVYFPRAIGYLTLLQCHVSWFQLATFAESMDLRVFYSLNSNGSIHDHGSESAADFIRHRRAPGELCTLPVSLQQVGSLVEWWSLPGAVPISPVMTHCLWPAMAEVEYQRYMFSPHDIDLLQHSMPQLQSLEVRRSGLKTVSNVFPWTNDFLRLPRNLSRRSYVNTHYYGYGLHVPRAAYRRTYSLSDNEIGDLENVKFHGLLQQISLDNNSLTSIPRGVFGGVVDIQHLDLSLNQIALLAKESFNNLSTLLVLSLQSNIITDIEPGVFDDLVSVQSIDLSSNKLTRLPEKLFDKLSKLETLKLENNFINYIPESVINVEFDHVKIVNLANNHLVTPPQWVFMLRTPNKIDLSSNNITMAGINNMTANMDLYHLLYQNIIGDTIGASNARPVFEKYVNLQSNQIQLDLLSLPDPQGNNQENGFYLLLNLFNMDLKGNGMQCDCAMYNFSSIVIDKTFRNRYYEDNLLCVGDEGKEVVVSTLPNTTFRCVEPLAQCPEECICSRRAIDNKTHVSCVSSSLSILPSHLPTNAYLLDLSHNDIATITELPQDFETLEILILSDLHLTTISESVFQGMSELKQLDLSSNRLEHFPKALHNIPDSVESLLLGDNRYACDCKDAWARDWLIQNLDNIQDLRNMICYSGREESKQIIVADPDKFICEKTLLDYMVPFTIVISVIAIVLLVVVPLLYKFRGTIRLCLYLHLNWRPFDPPDSECVDTLKQYDAFVSYSSINYKWVCKTLRPFLETRSPPYRLCLHDRDFEVGAPIIENILDSIERSRRTIMVVSWHFLQSTWCMTEFREAYRKVLQEKANYIIVILLDEIEVDDLDDDLQQYITTNTYLSVHNRWFWQKLLLALPKEPLSVLNPQFSDGLDGPEGGIGTSYL